MREEFDDYKRMSLRELRNYLEQNPLLIDPQTAADEWGCVIKETRESMRENEEDAWAVNSDVDDVLRSLGESYVNILTLNKKTVERKCAEIQDVRREQVIDSVMFVLARKAADLLGDYRGDSVYRKIMRILSPGQRA